MVGEEGRREIGDSVRDSQASAPSEFDISSTEVEQALRTQGKTCSMCSIMSENYPTKSPYCLHCVYIFSAMYLCISILERFQTLLACRLVFVFDYLEEFLFVQRVPCSAMLTHYWSSLAGVYIYTGMAYCLVSGVVS